MVFSLAELIDIIIMSAAAGYIFMDFFQRPSSGDPVKDFVTQSSFANKFWYAVTLVAVPILLHELAHKFTAMSFGLTAEFNAAYGWLGLGVFLKLIGSSFIFMVPAYVSIIGEATPAQHVLTAFAGPAVHLVLWIAALLVLRLAKLSEGQSRFWTYTKYINGLLFIFNMLPIWGFDGYHIFRGLQAMWF